MIYVVCFHRFAPAGIFDPVTGQLKVQWWSRDADDRPIGGHFGRMVGLRWVFYRLHGDLYLRVDRRTLPALRAESWTWRLDDVSIKWSASGRKSKLVVAEPNRDPVEITYRVFGWIENDPTPFVEYEDFDFGLFIFNVQNDWARRKRIYGPTSDSGT